MWLSHSVWASVWHCVIIPVQPGSVPLIHCKGNRYYLLTSLGVITDDFIASSQVDKYFIGRDTLGKSIVKWEIDRCAHENLSHGQVGRWYDWQHSLPHSETKGDTCQTVQRRLYLKSSLARYFWYLLRKACRIMQVHRDCLADALRMCTWNFLRKPCAGGPKWEQHLFCSENMSLSEQSCSPCWFNDPEDRNTILGGASGSKRMIRSFQDFQVCAGGLSSGQKEIFFICF